MTRRISKRGNAYTEGSSSARGLYPKTCAAGPECLHGGKIVLAHEHPLWFEAIPREPLRSWHFDCRPRVEALP